MSRTPKTYRCKIGTMPSTIVKLRYRYHLAPGKIVLISEHESYWGVFYWGKWGRVRINEVWPDGSFFKCEWV